MNAAAGGTGLFGAVVVVRDLARSERFYRELLELRVDVSSTDAVLLSAPTGDRLILRALSDAPHVSGAIGPLILVWTVDSASDLDRAAGVLRSGGALVSRSAEHGWEILEGRDPDDIRVIVIFRADPSVAVSSLPPRVYEY